MRKPIDISKELPKGIDEIKDRLKKAGRGEQAK